MKHKGFCTFLALTLSTSMILGGCGTAGTGSVAVSNESTKVSKNTDDVKSDEAEVSKSTDAVKLDEVETTMYYRTANDERPIKIYFADEKHEIPYFNTDTVKELLENIYHDIDLDNGFKLTVETNGHTAKFTRESGYTMELDCDADVIRFVDYDAFLVPSSSPTVIDILEHYGLIPCLKPVEESSYSRYGSEISFELAPYGIDLIEKDGVCYMPMQTFGDLITSLASYVTFLYDGEKVYVNEALSNNEEALMEKYYEAKVEDSKRSEALTNFAYQELCMTLDYCYGLKEQHNITSFDKFFDETGLKQRLLGEDTLESSKALYDLMYLYFADMHSRYYGNSNLIGKDADTSGKRGKSVSQFWDLRTDFKETRSKVYPEGVPGYEEIGETAYITFDMFDTLPAGVDYYKNPPTADAKDAVGICLYAFSQITREGSPVKNVVLDLSCNGGGDSTTASFVLSMFLGNASICLENSLTGAYMNETFCCDANLDGKFDEADSLKDYRLFCLISPTSFSCGNLVPSVLQNSKRVKLVGMTSGGGACVVMPIATADGTRITISGYRRLGYMKNGSVYDIDQGVEPDYPITSIERFYDRKALTDYINGLY